MEKPTIKEKAAIDYVEYLEAKLKVYTDSPYVNSYLALNKVVDAFNAKINETGIDEILENKSFEKFLSTQKKYLEQLEDYKRKMTPNDRKTLDQKMKESAGIAERIALESKNGNGRTV